MKMNTPQELGRTTNAFLDLKAASEAIDTVLELKSDFRALVAMRVLWELKELTDIRIVKDPTTWEEAWPNIFDADRLARDLASDDGERREAALRVEQAVTDLLATMDRWASGRPFRVITEEYEQIVLRTRQRYAVIEREVAIRSIHPRVASPH